MKYISIIAILLISFSFSEVQGLSFKDKQRLLSQAVTAQDTCYYVLLDAGSSSTKIRFYSSNCRKYSSIPQLTAMTPQGINTKYDQALSKVTQTQTSVQSYFDAVFNIVSQIKTSFNIDTVKLFLFLRATAGLRLLPQDQQDSILGFTRTVFSKKSDFIYLDSAWAKVISGEDEGLFLWISTNYAYSNIKHGNTVAFDSSKSVAVIDIGGASAQVAFGSKTDTNKFLDLPERTRLQIYSQSILGYGNDQVLKSIVGLTNYESCFQKCDSQYTYYGKTFDGNFNYVKCANAILGFMQINQCTYSDNFADGYTCNSNSPLKNMSAQTKIVGVSSVLYAKQNLGITGDSFIMKDFRKKVIDFCSQKLVIPNNTSSKDQDILRGNCMQMMWVSTFLIDGLGLLNNQITSIAQYNNFNLDWSLGSLVYDINTMQCDYLDTTQCDQLNSQIGTEKPTNSQSSQLTLTLLLSLSISTLM